MAVRKGTAVEDGNKIYHFADEQSAQAFIDCLADDSATSCSQRIKPVSIEAKKPAVTVAARGDDPEFKMRA